MRSRWSRTVHLTYGLISVGAALIGVLLLLIPELVFPNSTLARALLQNIGAVVLVAIPLTAFWEFFARRVFFEQIFEKTRSALSLRNAGVVEIHEVSGDVNWAELFERCTKLDIFVSYARTWARSNHSAIRNFCKSERHILRVFLSDYEDPETMEVLAKRFGSIDPAKLMERVHESEESYRKLAEDRSLNGTIEIYLVATPLLYSLYRFDDKIVVSMFLHRDESADPPTMILSSDGHLFSVFESDLEWMVKVSERVRKVF